MGLRALAAVVVETLEAGAGSYPIAVFAGLTTPVVLRTFKAILIMAWFTLPGDSKAVTFATTFTFFLGLGTEDTVFVCAGGDYDKEKVGKD